MPQSTKDIRKLHNGNYGNAKTMVSSLLLLPLSQPLLLPQWTVAQRRLPFQTETGAAGE